MLLLTQVNKVLDKLFLLDTGAWDNAITLSAAREATKIHFDDDFKVKGLSSEVSKVYTTEICDSFVRQFPAGDARPARLRYEEHQRFAGDGGFAHPWFRDAMGKIDYRDHLVDFQYNPNHARGATPY